METVRVLENQGVIEVTLSRPEVRNALSPRMIEELTQIFESCDEKSKARLLVLKGDGLSFCAGADLKWMKDMVDFDFDTNLVDADRLYGLFHSMWECPIPILSVVHGAAYGGAIGFLAASDFVIAEEKTQFAFSEVRLGIAPAVISDFILRKVPLGQVQAYFTSGRSFEVEQALRMGLVHLSAPAEQLSDQEHSVVESYLQAGPRAVRATKALSLELIETNYGRSITTELISQLRVSAEGQAGLHAFLKKSKPPWWSAS